MSTKLSFSFMLFTFILLSDLWPECSSDIFSAMFKMEHLLKTRQRVINDLDVYIYKEENRLRDLKMYSKMYKKEHERAMQDLINYTGNPINAFILIKRLTSDLDDIEELINKPTEFVSVRNVTTDDNNATILYPSAVDLQGAAVALKRLQRTYKLRVEDLARGVLKGVLYSNSRNVAIGLPMTASDCYKIGVIMLEKKDYMNGLAWQMEALHKFKLEDSLPHSITEINIKENIATLYHNMGDTETAVEWTLRILEIDPDNKRAQKKLIEYDHLLDLKENEDDGELILYVDDKNKTNTNNSTEMKDNNGTIAVTDAKNETDTKHETDNQEIADLQKNVDVPNTVDANDDTLSTNGSNNKDVSVIISSKTESDALNNEPDAKIAEADDKTVTVDKTEAIYNSKSNKNEASAKINDNAQNITETKTDKAAEFRQLLNDVIDLRNDSLIYEALCRGEYEISPEISSRLTCRYVNDSPFLKLAPIKMEQKYIDPDVFLFHDVISDEEIAHIQEMAKPGFYRATVGDLSTYNKVSNFRIGEVSWLSDKESEVVARLSQRISDFTGLDVKYAEGLQISNYGVGGHFEPHYDHNNELIKENPIRSHRIATTMFYMSDVAQGGATVFPKLGLTVFPVKGAALFWKNLLPSGEGDLNTKHAACPVLVGSKWVSNKWLGQWGQEFVAPCSLEYQRGDICRQRPPPVLKIKSFVKTST